MGSGLPYVPILSQAYILPKTIDELVVTATGKSQLNDEAMREGIVLRPLTEMQDEDLGRLSFKVINPEYLLKHE
jgi:hypothetical protein